MISCRYIQDYIDLVRSGKYRVCREQLLLIDFVEAVFEEEAVYIDEEQTERYFALEKYFPYRLFEWERFCFTLHNCVYSAPGILRFPKLVILVGRGAGKNGYLAFEDFALLTPVNGIKHYDIDICANSEDQAMKTFERIYDLLEDNAAVMRKKFRWNRVVIENLKTKSKLRYRTSGAKSKDGGDQGKVDFDEYHAYENYELLNVFRTGLGKKPMPRETIITTMGDVRDGPLDELLADMLQILNGDIPDNGMLCFICRLDSLDEVNDELNWYKANPSLQYFPVLLGRIRDEYIDWKRNEHGHASFITKRMNIPFGTAVEVVTDWENIKATARDVIDLEGRECIFGIDYAKINDFLAVVLKFRVGGMIYTKQHSWVCAQSRDLSRVKFPIRDAEREGLLTVVDAVEISPELPVKWLAEMKQRFCILAGALDSYRYDLLKRYLAQIGFDPDRNGEDNLKLVRPSDIVKAVPIIKSDLDNQRVIFGDDKLMRWYTNNTKLVPVKGAKYNTDNYSFGKIEPKSRKNDGFSAFAATYTQDDRLTPDDISGDIFDLMRVRSY